MGQLNATQIIIPGENKYLMMKIFVYSENNFSFFLCLLLPLIVSCDGNSVGMGM